MSGPDCAGVRARMGELLDSPADAALADHAGRCEECAGELRALRAVMRAAQDWSLSDVPEPGTDYWDSFIPRLRDRIARDDALRRTPRRPKVAAGLAAAALMMLAAVLPLMLHRNRPQAQAAHEVADAETALDDLLARSQGSPAEEALSAYGGSLGSGVIPFLEDSGAPVLELPDAPDLEGAEVLEMLGALRQMSAPHPFADLWADRLIESLVEGLDNGAADRLRVQLASEPV
ncbi:MAG TPA: hypothetical protein VFP98_01890 [Candidatus Polarisedimenticolia bacterium]|nr:hypothetical protein [Candidatus Polarisedimenticolia bacterium]